MLVSFCLLGGVSNCICGQQSLRVHDNYVYHVIHNYVNHVNCNDAFLFTGVTIGFEETEYTVREGVDPTVQICAVLISGTLERGTIVTFSTSDGSAMGMYNHSLKTYASLFWAR